MSLRPTLALLALVSLPLMAAQNDPQPSSKELMKEHQAQIQNDLADVDYKRKRIVEANMNLTDQEGEKFWPIYNTYRTESDKLSKETLRLLLDYAQAYNSGNVSDDQASKLIERVDDLQEDRLELRDKYVKRIAKNVRPSAPCASCRSRSSSTPSPPWRSAVRYRWSSNPLPASPAAPCIAPGRGVPAAKGPVERRQLGEPASLGHLADGATGQQHLARPLPANLIANLPETRSPAASARCKAPLPRPSSAAHWRKP